MERVNKVSGKYLKTLKERAKESRAYRPYQSDGLILADILKDARHKSLYIRLSKIYGGKALISLAKNVAERKDIANKGAYFMKILQTKGLLQKYDARRNLDNRK